MPHLESRLEKHALAMLFGLMVLECILELYMVSRFNFPKEVEVRAILHALKESRSHFFNKIQLLSDACEVILAIKGLMDWSIHHILLVIKYLTSKFEEISFTHIPRNVNVFAHELTKMSYGSSSHVRSFCSLVRKGFFFFFVCCSSLF